MLNEIEIILNLNETLRNSLSSHLILPSCWYVQVWAIFPSIPIMQSSQLKTLRPGTLLGKQRFKRMLSHPHTEWCRSWQRKERAIEAGRKLPRAFVQQGEVLHKLMDDSPHLKPILPMSNGWFDTCELSLTTTVLEIASRSRDVVSKGFLNRAHTPIC